MSRIAGDSALQSELPERFFDARRYRRWLADLALLHLGDDPIEIGSGNGDYALEWMPHVRRFTATEADPVGRAANEVREPSHYHGPLPGAPFRDPGGALGRGVAQRARAHPRRHDGMRAMARLVRPGAPLVLIVPAFPSAMSRFDRAIGHERRYTQASLGGALRSAGLTIQELRYVNPIGLLSWYLEVRVLEMTSGNGPLLGAYDRLVVPVSRWIEQMTRPPFGQSVFAVGAPPADQPHRAGKPCRAAQDPP